MGICHLLSGDAAVKHVIVHLKMREAEKMLYECLPALPCYEYKWQPSSIKTLGTPLEENLLYLDFKSIKMSMPKCMWPLFGPSVKLGNYLPEFKFINEFARSKDKFPLSVVWPTYCTCSAWNFSPISLH